MSLRVSDVFPSTPPPQRRRKRRTRPADRESAVLRECLLLLKRCGALAIRTNSGLVQLADGNWMKGGAAGWPDITGLLPGGRFIGVECKARHGGRQSAAQRRIEQQIRDRNGIYILARGAEDVRKAIENANTHG